MESLVNVANLLQYIQLFTNNFYAIQNSVKFMLIKIFQRLLPKKLWL